MIGSIAEQISISSMGAQLRTLHHIAAHCICHKSGNCDRMGDMDLQVVQGLKRNMKINVGAILFEGIRSIAKSKECTGNLIYCASLSFLFAHSDVYLAREESLIAPTIGVSILTRGKFVSVKGRLVKKISEHQVEPATLYLYFKKSK